MAPHPPVLIDQAECKSFLQYRQMDRIHGGGHGDDLQAVDCRWHRKGNRPVARGLQVYGLHVVPKVPVFIFLRVDEIVAGGYPGGNTFAVRGEHKALPAVFVGPREGFEKGIIGWFVEHQVPVRCGIEHRRIHPGHRLHLRMFPVVPVKLCQDRILLLHKGAVDSFIQAAELAELIGG